MDLLPLIPTGASRVPGKLVLTWAHLDLVILVPTLASPGSGDSGPQFGLTLTW